MNEKILIVDDEKDILRILNSILTKEGFEVRNACEGNEAIEIFKAEHFDLVITDIRMPGMDGIEVLKKVKALDKDIEVIILTGFATMDNAIEALRDGRAFDYLTKPLDDVDALIMTVNKALERRRLRKENRSLLNRLQQANTELEQRVEARTVELEKANIALHVLLEKRDQDKKEFEARIVSNVKTLILPYLEKLKKGQLPENRKAYVNIIETNLNELISPFAHGVSHKYFNLTPTEIQIADLIKQGHTTKEIAEFLNVSAKTVEFHRDNIRKKLGIKNKKINLRTHLLSFK